MSDTPQGPGWWQASDGAWYPPEQHSDPNHRAQYANAAMRDTGSAPAMAPGPANPTGYPVWFDTDPPRPIDNWRALAHIFMAIPHLIIRSVLGYVVSAVAVISWFAILFTGRLPAGLANFQMMYIRYNNRMMTYVLLFHQQYPPFAFDMTATDPDTTPERTSAVVELENRNRLTVFFRLILVIPHAIVLALLGIAALVVYIVGWFSVLFRGHMSEGVSNFLIGYGRWATRVSGYGLLLTDMYPPFSTD